MRALLTLVYLLRLSALNDYCGGLSVFCIIFLILTLSLEF